MNTEKKRGRPVGLSRSEFQCISFLTTKGLSSIMEKLVHDGKIGHYWFVEHEPDEDTKKVHHHLRMTPPISGSVNWQEIVALVVENVPGESLPRRLVASSRACNNESHDGLLYARHDARYCRVKGLVKSHYDYGRNDFHTDDKLWLDELWAQSDNFKPVKVRLGIEDVVSVVERNPRMSKLELLRLCLVNGLNKGQKDMLEELRREVLANNQPVSVLVKDEFQDEIWGGEDAQMFQEAEKALKEQENEYYG